ncbi:MAG TPA: PEP/pyruvate-binding domain-containing protein [Polyangiaceae bacterium]|nr:PEP/pyruvate-binding domain-containing protein [Polyangiaceae bacterium]
MRLRALAALLLLVSCSNAPVTAPAETQCAEASARSGELECVHRIEDENRWAALTVPALAVDQARTTKYLLPARSGARLLPLFINASRYELHYDFMVHVFPELFAGLTTKQYLELLFNPEQRELYAGTVTEYRLPEGGTELGFTIAGDPSTPGLFDCDDVRKVRGMLLERLPTSELLAVPSDREQLGFFSDCGVPTLDPTAIEYEAYHRAAAFGRVRRLRSSEVASAVDSGSVSYQDLLILEQAPSDIETVVSGVVSGSRQAPLSHLAVRSASRGTPNCYLKDAYGYFESWQDELVRLECGDYGVEVRAATADEAEQYWQQLRPEPVQVPEPDRDFVDLVPLEQVPLESATDRRLGTSRFGSKARNLAWLRQTLDPALTPKGLAIPVAHYLRFIQNNSWSVDLGDGAADHTLADTLAAWQVDERFGSDAAFRRERLAALQDAFKTGRCDPELLTALQTQLMAVFGAVDVSVRFRSSSNAEDGAFFNGAGLYDSFSGCLADDLDDDELGPSACDPAEPDEHGACRALRKVWASLFNPKAVDERAFYGIDSEHVAMGVLVNERSEAELANMVAFSGNPLASGDDRYLVNAQIDELPVVSPEPGMWPEQDLLSVEAGDVVSIERELGSSQLPKGKQVLSDAQLEALGAQLSTIAERYPFDATAPRGHTFLVDTEWKLMPDGTLRVKQVRPFLR